MTEGKDRGTSYILSPIISFVLLSKITGHYSKHCICIDYHHKVLFIGLSILQIRNQRQRADN